MQQLPTDDSSSELARHYEYYQQSVKNNLMNRGHEKEDADDLYQDIFLKLLEHSSRWGVTVPQGNDHLRHLLFNIADQIRIDKYRRTKKFKFIPLPEDEDKAYTEDKSYTQYPQLMVEFDVDDWLQQVLAQMPLRHQQCVSMIERGFNQKEIAKELGISPARVSEIMSDVRTQLQRKKYYPVAHSLEREILSWRQDAEKLLNCVHDDADILITKLNPMLSGWNAFYEKSLDRVENSMTAMRNSWAKLGRFGIKLDDWQRYEYVEVNESVIETFDALGFWAMDRNKELQRHPMYARRNIVAYIPIASITKRKEAR